MAQNLKRIALAAAASAAIAGTAQAQAGYEYLFWPLINAAPAPTVAMVHAQIQAPASAPAPAVASVAAPRRAQQDYIQETAEIRYAPSGPVGRPASPSQSVILGVGF